MKISNCCRVFSGLLFCLFFMSGCENPSPKSDSSLKSASEVDVAKLAQCLKDSLQTQITNFQDNDRMLRLLKSVKINIGRINVMNVILIRESSFKLIGYIELDCSGTMERTAVNITIDGDKCLYRCDLPSMIFDFIVDEPSGMFPSNPGSTWPVPLIGLLPTPFTQ